MTTLSYVTDLFDNQLALAEGSQLRTWIQGFPLGEWTHPQYGKISMTPQRVANFVKNFYDKVRGTDLDIDYEHKEFTSKAAGWIVEAEDRGPDGLWLLVEWTPSALQALQEREYRYFSPEFADKWTNPKTKQAFNDVLFGGAITNRPFLKDILPINLSEFGHTSDGDDHMHELLKQLSELLGVKLSDDDSASTETVVAAIQKLKEAPTGPAGGTDGLTKLAETHPEIAQLLADRAEDKKRLEALETASRLSEAKIALSDLNKPEFTLTPAFTEVMVPVLAALPKKLGEDVVKALRMFSDGTAAIKLGEVGGGHTGSGESGDPVGDFEKAIEALIKEDPKLNFADAAIKLSITKPDIYERYALSAKKEGNA